MKNKAKITAAVAFLLAVCFVLCSCGAKEEYVEIKNQTGISCSWWGNDVRHLYTIEGIGRFMDKNPDIRVSYRYGVWDGYERRNKVFMYSNTESDVMQINFAWLKQYSPDGNGYYDLSKLSDIIDLSNFTEDDLGYGTVNGKLNALPIALNTSTVFYNKDIFDSYGLELPKTWDDLYAAAEVMSKDDVYVLGMAKKHVFLLLNAYLEQTRGKAFFKEDGTLNVSADDIEYMLEFYKELIDKKVMMHIDDFSNGDFINRKVAGSICWVSDADKYCQPLSEEGANVVVGDYPASDNAKRGGRYIKPATMYAISDITEHPDEAARLLNYLLNDPEMAVLQGTEKGVPVSKSAIKALQENGQTDNFGYRSNEKMLEDRDEMELMQPELENDNIITAFKTNADDYLYGKAEAEACAEAIYDEIKEMVGK